MCYVIDCYIGMIINKSLVAGLRCGGWAGRGPSPLDTLPAALSTLPTFCIPPDTETPSPPPHSDQQIANWRLLLHAAFCTKDMEGKRSFWASLRPPPCSLHHVLPARAGLRSAVTLIFTQHYISSTTCKLLVLLPWMHSPAPFCLLNFVCTNIRTKCKILWGSVMPLG